MKPPEDAAMVRGMTQRPAIATHVLTVALLLAEDGAPPKRIVVFPTGGDVSTRDGRRFVVGLQALAARYGADGLKIPIDINHSTEILAPKGERADPVGWVVGLAVEAGRLMADVEWVDPDAVPALLKAYPYVSPAFAAPGGVAKWIKSVALVSSPALSNQPALASADPLAQEPAMKTVITALGLAEGASEAECLAAVVTLKSQSDPAQYVSKAIHQEAVAKLSAATAELDGLKAAGLKADVDALLTAALTAKKIVPAQRAQYEMLCATPEGLATVKQLLEAAPVLLGGATLDGRKVPDAAAGGDVAQLSATEDEIRIGLGLTVEEWRAANPPSAA